MSSHPIRIAIIATGVTAAAELDAVSAKDVASKKGEFSPKRAAIWMFGPSRVKGSPIPGLRRQRRSGARLRGKQGRQSHLIPCGSSLAIH